MCRMKRARRIIIVMMCVVLTAAMDIRARASKDDNAKIFYTVTGEGEAVIIGSDAGQEELVIPAYIGEIPVVGIGEAAFRGRTDIRRLTVESGVRYIAANAFSGCERLEQIELEEGLRYIGNSAFYENVSVENIFVLDSVAYVGENAFGNCRALIEITVPQAAYVDAYAFEGSAWQDLRDGGKFRIRGSCLIEAWGVRDPVLEIPYGVTRIADRRLVTGDVPAVVDQDMEFEEIILPDTLVELGISCFNRIQVRKLHLPPGIKEIGTFVFNGAKLEEILLPEKLEVLGDWVFADASVETIKLPDTLKVIQMGAFCGCKSLREIAIPASVRYIDHSAFIYCDSLSEVAFEEGIEAIHAGAFGYNDSLERLQFPESLKSIEGDTYSASLKRIYIPGGTTNIDEGIFRFFERYETSIAVYGQKGSRAEELAAVSNMMFEAVASGDEMP